MSQQITTNKGVRKLQRNIQEYTTFMLHMTSIGHTAVAKEYAEQIVKALDAMDNISEKWSEFH